jgi:hypothetical protein
MLHDHSTLNLDELRNLPTCELPDRYHLQTDPGNGCAGDPPGYPTYFTRSVYTPAGNHPTRGPEQVISHDGVLYVTGSSGDWGKGETFDTVHARSHALMRRLYVSLPFDHPRVQAWIAQTMRHQASMYIDDEGLAENPEYGRPARIVFPTPDYKLHHFHDDKRFSEEWRTAEQAAVAAYNADVQARYAKVATLTNHVGVRAIREFYPEYTPVLDEDGRPATIREERVGDWWERLAARPSVTECKPPGWMQGHRAEGWCQFCGHVTTTTTEVIA